MVKVRIRAGYTGFRLHGVEMQPGDEFHVEQDRARWLESIGAIEPLFESKKKHRAASRASRIEADEETADRAVGSEDGNDGESITES